MPIAYGLPPAKANPNRALLVVAVLVLLALLTGGVVYKSRQHAALAKAAMSEPAPAAPASNAPAPPVTPQSTSTEGAHPNAAPTAVPQTPPSSKTTTVARKAAAQSDDAATSGPSAANLQADQQAAEAAAKRKKLLDDMETENDQLNTRASAVESSLETLEQQMHNSGLGLRGDMVAARGNMRNDLSKAQQALDGGDTDRARHFLDLAHREVEKLEGFMGRR
jgi:hypothetical protein